MLQTFKVSFCLFLKIITKLFRPTMGQQILKRACTLRSEMKGFLAYLEENKVEELAQELHNFVTDCVNNIENADNVSFF